MIFGMRIWGPAGALELDENSFTVRVVYSALVSTSGRSVYIAIPGVSPSTHVGVCIPNGNWSNSSSSQDAGNVQFDVQVLEGGVNVWFCNRTYPSGRIAVGTQRLLVLRYR
ncbi:hypothetical protein E4T65_17360 [Pseudomonas fluorescens]|uniref:Uncharacterized protein n=1 Tax=Pseudomonas fluorescens TaxID=294 RepID=A0A4Y9TI98_PSEFL|nr:hypothetical protein E4T65_17360 [Pseudomonas fluorescens]